MVLGWYGVGAGERGRIGRGYALGSGGYGGGGNLRVAKTPPLQSAWAGIPLRRMPPTTICAHMGINGNGEWEDHDAARRVATSSEKLGE